MKDHEAYQALPATVAQQVLRVLDTNWQRCCAAPQAWQADPSKFLGQPRLPRYQDTQQGRNLLIDPLQARRLPALRRHMICPSRLGIPMQTRQPPHTSQQVRIIPRSGCYVVEVIYERAPVPAAVTPALHAGVDSGLNTLAMRTSDQPGFVPRVVNGRPVTSSNQFYNKRRTEVQSQLGIADTSRRLERLTTKRTRRIDHDRHTASIWRLAASSTCWWQRASVRCASARIRSGSRKRTWADGAISTSFLCPMRASLRC
jgi:putative transposase